jgi:hypothetical protein
LTITHLDSLCHQFWDGQMYNGKPASLVTVQQKATAGECIGKTNAILHRRRTDNTARAQQQGGAYRVFPSSPQPNILLVY